MSDSTTIASFIGMPGPQHPDVEGRALGSAALTYFLSAGSERIGLSAAAAEQLRNGCIEVQAYCNMTVLILVYVHYGNCVFNHGNFVSMQRY